MSFMQPFVTDSQPWIKIDGNHGITFVPFPSVCNTVKAFQDKDEDAQLEAVSDYYEGTADSVEVVTGFGARFSAPGYMDCTEWSVFDTEDDATAYLASEADEDEEDEELACPHGNGSDCSLC